MTSGEPLDSTCLSAPRRRHADPDSASLAIRIAANLYPAPSDSSLPQVIKYEKGVSFPKSSLLSPRDFHLAGPTIYLVGIL